MCLSLLAMSGAASAATPAWTTYHHDGARSGIDPDSTSPVAPGQAWQTPALDGPVWSQPLVYGSTVYVATENDSVYALNAATGAVVWQKHVATAVPSGQLPCGDVSPVGITSTPVIDPATGRIYVVADTWNGSSSASIAHQLFALNLSDGSVAVGPVPVDPPGSTHTDQLQRASLALDAGKVIIGYGGNDGDCGSYHGWLVAVPEGGGSLQTFEVDPSTNGGAIWAAGNAPAIDSAGDIWTSTGNGSSSSFAYQESVIRLDPNLNVLDYWAPSNWSSLDSSDTDLGSAMPLLLPNGLVFQIGKAGVGYLLSFSNLGHTGGAPVFQASVCNGSFGGGIYVNGVIYVACSNGVHALSLNGNSFAPLSLWTVNSSAVGPPIFAGGLVWSAGTGNGTLYGLDPSTGATRFSAGLGSFEHFTTPSAGGGRLFVANTNKVTAFQIANAPAPSPTTPTATTATLVSSANPSLAGRGVTYTATITPAPDGGAVSFTDAGSAIGGCSTVPVNTSSGQAMCTTSYAVASKHSVAASYAGDSNFGASGANLTQVVYAIPPVISHLKATAFHRKLRLSLTISQSARLAVTIYRQASGRIVRKRCRIDAKHGKACKLLLRRARITVGVRRGRNRIAPRMRPLAPGRYVLTVTAVTAAGGRSRTYTVRLLVPRR